MSYSSEGSNRRRFKRVDMHFDMYGSSAGIGANIEWPSGESTPAYDMSYTGAAVGRPQKVDFTVGESLPVIFHFSGADKEAAKAGVSAKVVWVNESMVGLDFSDQESYARRALMSFLEDKLIGALLTEIDQKYFSEGLDCSYWLHGPNETNFYIWLNQGQIVKAELEFSGNELIFGSGKWQGYVEDAEYLKRVISVLSQVQTPGAAMKKLLQSLSELLRIASKIEEN